MENVTSYINDSHENETFLPRFPFWQSTLAVWTITIILIQPAVIATDLTLLVTMLKSKKLCHPLNFIHMSIILVSHIASRLIFFISYVAYFPLGWKNCNCSVFWSSLQHSESVYIIICDSLWAYCFCFSFVPSAIASKRETEKAYDGCTHFDMHFSSL